VTVTSPTLNASVACYPYASIVPMDTTRDGMALTPTEEAKYALDYGVSRSDLSLGARIEYDRLVAEDYGTPSPTKAGPMPPQTPPPSWPQAPMYRPPPPYVPPRPPASPRKPVNPWMGIGWIILILLIIGIWAGSSHHRTSHPVRSLPRSLSALPGTTGRPSKGSASHFKEMGEQ
jgi:hypothetical protein